MIMEIAIAATLSGAAIGWMIGQARYAEMKASRYRWVIRADKCYREWSAAERRLTAIHRQRSEAVSRGNRTRSAKRKALQDAKTAELRGQA